jgi:hypothetical protein
MTKEAFDAMDKNAMISLEWRFPTKEEIAAAMVSHQTSSLFASCTPTAKTGSCYVRTPLLGKLLLYRRRWYSVLNIHKSDAKTANHYHLRVGDIILDSTFMQFDAAAADIESKGELFVGTKDELINRLDNMTKPEISPGKTFFETYWEKSAPKVEQGKQVRLVWRGSGVADWDPTTDAWKDDIMARKDHGNL